MSDRPETLTRLSIPARNRYFGGLSSQADRDDFRNAEIREIAIEVPLYGYSHGVEHISTTPFTGRAPHAEWDSGQIGVAYILGSDAREHFGVKKLRKDLRDRLPFRIVSDVEAIDAWINEVEEEVDEDEDEGY